MPVDQNQSVKLAEVLPGLSITTFYQYFRRGEMDELVKIVENLYLQAQKRAGISNPSCTSPITFCDVLNLLKLLGWFAPAGQFVPPAGVPVENINLFLNVDAGETRSVCWTTGDEAAIMDEFQVDPLNLTAQESVRAIQRFEIARVIDDIAANGMFQPVQNCVEQAGLTVVEHITIPPKNTLTLLLRNFDTESRAVVRVTGKLWRTL
jgi:hypothetical protein